MKEASLSAWHESIRLSALTPWITVTIWPHFLAAINRPDSLTAISRPHFLVFMTHFVRVERVRVRACETGRLGRGARGASRIRPRFIALRRRILGSASRLRPDPNPWDRSPRRWLYV